MPLTSSPSDPANLKAISPVPVAMPTQTANHGKFELEQGRRTPVTNTALITGASSGIGREFARVHAENGCDLVLVALEGEMLEELKHELESQHSVRVLAIEIDLTRPDAPQEIFDIVHRAGIEIEFLFNNAGVGGYGKFHERDWAADLSMIQLNIVALTALTRLFLPDMIRRNRGRILNVSSTASLLPGPLQAVYFATKAFVSSFTNAVAEELYDTNITVTALLPGPTRTGFARNAGLEKTGIFKKTASPRSVASEGYAAMMAGRLNVFSGLSLSQRLMMEWIRFTPRRILLRHARQMHQLKE